MAEGLRTPLPAQAPKSHYSFVHSHTLVWQLFYECLLHPRNATKQAQIPVHVDWICCQEGRQLKIKIHTSAKSYSGLRGQSYRAGVSGKPHLRFPHSPISHRTKS